MKKTTKGGFLGFDGGGTKTDCVLMDGEGRVVAHGRGGPSNPLRSGTGAAWRVLTDLARKAMRQGNARPGDIEGVCAGLAGAGHPAVARRMKALFQKRFPKAQVAVTTDMEIALRAAVGTGEGVVILGGTGSAAYGRNRRGETARAGGRGPWFGDEGSAYEIGRRAAAAAARAEDGLSPATMLSEKILRGARCRNWEDLSERAAREPDKLFSGIFPIVLEAGESGDAVARKIVHSAAAALASLGEKVAERLGLGDSPFSIVCMGGIFGRNKDFDAAVEGHLKTSLPFARIAAPRTTPAQAAAETARTTKQRGRKRPEETHDGC